jgi:hypothetical protein
MIMYATIPRCDDNPILIPFQRLLEANLATMNDSVDLLKAEIAKEEALLASDKKALLEMDKNAKRAEVERKRQTKNVCDGVCIYPKLALTVDSRNTRCFGSWIRFLQPRALRRLSLLFLVGKKAQQLWMRYVLWIPCQLFM